MHDHFGYVQYDDCFKYLFKIDLVVVDASNSNAASHTAYVVQVADSPYSDTVEELLMKIEKLKELASSPSSPFRHCTTFVPVLGGRCWSSQTDVKCKMNNPPVWRVQPSGARFEIRRTFSTSVTKRVGSSVIKGMGSSEHLNTYCTLGMATTQDIEKCEKQIMGLRIENKAYEEDLIKARQKKQAASDNETKDDLSAEIQFYYRRIAANDQQIEEKEKQITADKEFRLKFVKQQGTINTAQICCCCCCFRQIIYRMIIYSTSPPPSCAFPFNAPS